MNEEREVAAVLAGEVQAPLSQIRENTRQLSRILKDNDALRRVDIINSAIDKIEAVINARADKMPVFLEDLICDVIDEYHVKDNKRVEFVVETTGDELYVYAGYSKLCILFFNILKNAVEAVGDKGSVITRIRREGEYALVSVTDNGGGIDESIAAVIDRPYVSSKGSRGLGLTICRSIVDEYKGTLTMENTTGGCRVCVYLKLYKEKQK